MTSIYTTCKGMKLNEGCKCIVRSLFRKYVKIHEINT